MHAGHAEHKLPARGQWDGVFMRHRNEVVLQQAAGLRTQDRRLVFAATLGADPVIGQHALVGAAVFDGTEVFAKGVVIADRGPGGVGAQRVEGGEGKETGDDHCA